MKNCENCSSLHNGNYGSGRFCSSKCARGFSTKKSRKEINLKISSKLKGINSHTGKQSIMHELSCICGKNFLVANHRKDQIFCSIKCARLNKKHPLHTEKAKLNISKAIKKLYDDGKLVYGGKTKWIEVETSIGILKVQGTFELRACKILDFLKEINEIKNWEYTTDRIEYIGIDNKKHNYLLDFKIFKHDGSFYYLEIKGYERNTDKLKWDAVIEKGYQLEIWFNEHLRKYENLMELNKNNRDVSPHAYIM